MSKAYKAWRRKNRRRNKPGNSLVPLEWYEQNLAYQAQIANNIVSLKPQFTKQVRQAYFDSLYGNLYVKLNHLGQPSGNNCMFIKAHVGDGMYTSFDFIDMVTHRKFDESVNHNNIFDGYWNSHGRWQLVATLDVE